MIAVSAGHYNKAQGAVSKSGLVEWKLAIEWASIICDNLVTDNVLVPSARLMQKVNYINTLHVPAKLAIEIHFNSDATGRARGSEVLYYPGSVAGKHAALAIQKRLGILAPPNRGIKPGYYQLDPSQPVDYFLRAVRCTALIIEPCFINYYDDIRHRAESICRMIANICDNIVSPRL